VADSPVSRDKHTKPPKSGSGAGFGRYACSPKQHLVTNLVVNPNDVTRWDKEVVPGFSKIGLKATLCGLEKLDALLTKHPHVAEAFFEGQNRCFLSVGEAYEFTKADESGDSGLKVALLGRDAELSSVDAFLRGTQSNANPIPRLRAATSLCHSGKSVSEKADIC
jgi:hypothetical protein